MRAPGSNPEIRFVAAQPFGGAFVRSYWPSGYLHDLGYDSECSVKWPEDGDVIVIHRPLGRGNLEAILRYRDGGARVLISEDDDLTSLHQTKNPRQDLVDVAQHLACISAADGLIVTTDKLADIYGPMARETFLCPNYLPGWVAKQRMAHPHDKTNAVRARPRAQVRVGWAGNVDSHLHDLEWFRPVAQRAMSGALFSTIGDPRVPRVLGLQFFEVRDWAWRLHDLYARMSTADVGIVPLAPITFNESKSWLKALEYMTLGKPVVVSNMPEQAKLVTHGDDGFLADDPVEFADYVQTLIYDGELRAKMGERARAKAAAITLENMIDCWFEPLRLADRRGVESGRPGGQMADDEYREKIKSVGFPRKMGQSKKTPVRREDDGTVGGYQVEHWDGRQDAHITPKSVTVKSKVRRAE